MNMKIIEKKENLKSSIPFMALMCALIVCLSILATYLSFSSLIVALFITIPSVFVAILVPKKYYYIYFLSSLGLSLITSILDISFVLSFTLPSLIIGLIQGIFIDKKYNAFLLTYITSIIYFIIEIILLYLVNIILEINVIEEMENLLHLSNNEENKYIILILILFSSFIGVSLSTYVINFEIKKIGYNLTFNKYGDYFFSIISILLSIITLLCHFYNKNLECFLFIVTIISLIFLTLSNLSIKEYYYLFILLIIFPLYLIFIIFNLENYIFIYFSLLPIIYSIVVLLIKLLIYFKNKKEIQ